jgi:hypothetical protein
VSFFAFKVIAIFIRFPDVPFYPFHITHAGNQLFQVQFNLLLKEKIHLETQTSSLDVLVYNQEGIALPGATVTVTQPEGLKQTQSTNGEGLSRFPILLPGHYTAEAQMGGFQTNHKSGTLPVGQTVEIKIILALASGE